MHVPGNISEPQFVSVKIQVQFNGSVYSAHNQDPILVYPAKKISFVETDRGIYKAGDRLRIRILTLNHDMLPFKDYKVRQKVFKKMSENVNF